MHSNCCQGVRDASCSQFSCAAGTVSSGSPGDNANVVGAGAHVVGAHETFIQVEQLQKGLCGVSRPHFFRGVATVSLDHCLSALDSVWSGFVTYSCHHHARFTIRRCKCRHDVMPTHCKGCCLLCHTARIMSSVAVLGSSAAKELSAVKTSHPGRGSAFGLDKPTQVWFLFIDPSVHCRLWPSCSTLWSLMWQSLARRTTSSGESSAAWCETWTLMWRLWALQLAGKKMGWP